TLSFSREQEYQADTLGLKYMMAAGYDPAGAGLLLAGLTRATALEARAQGRTNRQTPEWALTHPLSENRMQRALAEARATGRLGGSLDQYILRVFQELTRGEMQLAIPAPRHVTINGMPAAVTTSEVNTQAGAIDVSVIAYQWDAQRIYHFVMLTAGGSGIGPFTPM